MSYFVRVPDSNLKKPLMPGEGGAESNSSSASRFRSKEQSRMEEEQARVSMVNMKPSTAPPPPVSSSKFSSPQFASEGYKYDLIIVLPNPEHRENVAKKFKPKIDIEEILERLHIARLQYYVFRSADNEEFIIKIRAPLDLLKEHADEIEFDMKIDERYLESEVDSKKHPIVHDPSEALSLDYYPLSFMFPLCALRYH